MMTLEKFYNEFADSHESASTAMDWLNGHRQEWMDDDQWLCALFLSRLFNGFHHVTAPIREFGRGVCINTRYGNLSTFDYDYLTKAVIMAHNWCIRLEIMGSGPGLIKLALWKRESREGRIHERHPTIKEAAEKYKDY